MKKGIGGAILALAVGLGVIVIGSTTAQAQGRYDRDRRYDRNRDWRNDRRRDNRRDNRRYDNRRYDNRRYGNNGAYQAELNRGFRQGLETGSSDARRRQSYNPQRSRHYRNARSRAFVDGFMRGYDQGYRQYAYGNRRGRGNSGGIGRIFGLPF